MGVFGFAEIIANLEHKDKREVFTSKVGKLMPSKEEFKYAYPAVLRGTALGSVLGVLPGGGALLSAFAAYTIEKKITRNPKIPFGKGNIRGVAAPESANNAGAQTSFIPMLTLGIPPNAVMALMVGAMTIHNIQPGPQVMTSNPALFWGLIASMWIGNLMLVVLNLPLIGIWVQLLKVPYRLLYPAILVFCGIGVYSINNNPFDVTVTAVFGLIGLHFLQAALRAGAADARLHSGADDGGEPAARDAAVARRRDRVLHAAAVAGIVGGRRGAGRDRRAAEHQEEARGSVPGSALSDAQAWLLPQSACNHYLARRYKTFWFEPGGCRSSVTKRSVFALTRSDSFL